MSDDSFIFDTHHPALLAHAYRMLGDTARAEDMVQEAWLAWNRRPVEVDSPRAFLITTVTRLCLDELGSARARKEESRGDRLPEPIDLNQRGITQVETLDQISMAFVVLLQRLTPAERAVFLLHEVFDLSHAEIAERLGKSDAASRQLLSRAKEHVASERRVFAASTESHRSLLAAFVRAMQGGEQSQLIDLLADDAVFVGDAGPNGGRYGKIRNVGRPVVGAQKIAALVRQISKQQVSGTLEFVERTLNGEPAIIALSDGVISAAIFVAVADGKIRHVFVQGDPDRLRHLSPQERQ